MLLHIAVNSSLLAPEFYSSGWMDQLVYSLWMDTGGLQFRALVNKAAGNSLVYVFV